MLHNFPDDQYSLSPPPLERNTSSTSLTGKRPRYSTSNTKPRGGTAALAHSRSSGMGDPALRPAQQRAESGTCDTAVGTNTIEAGRPYIPVHWVPPGGETAVTQIKTNNQSAHTLYY